MNKDDFIRETKEENMHNKYEFTFNTKNLKNKTNSMQDYFDSACILKNLKTIQKNLILYKTELCKSFEETNDCKYGLKCQFAHSKAELRPLIRHPRYKTEICKTYTEKGSCPYGKRCCFIHYEGYTQHIDINQKLKYPDSNYSMDKVKPSIYFNSLDTQKNEFNDQWEIGMFNSIQLNDESNKKSTDLPSRFCVDSDDDEPEFFENRPFVHKNLASLWMNQDQIFCYINKEKPKNRVFKSSNAPGEWYVYEPNTVLAKKILKHLDLL